MTVKIHKIFPTIIYETNINVDTQDRKYLKEEKYGFIYQDGVKNGYVTDEKYILNKKKFKNLKNKILNNIQIYLHDMLNVEKTVSFYITNSWCIKHEKNDKANSHFHDNSIISGVYYFDTPKNCGNLILERNKHTNSLFSSLISLDIKKCNDYNTNLYFIEVEEGKLVLFPSHQLHSTEKNLSNDNRYCLAFNVFFEGQIGINDSLNFLKIKNNKG
jgi:uncharacterized protein (TIGR02466 family)